MKRLLLLTTLLLSAVFPVVAQEDDDVQTAKPISGRYEFEIANDWIVRTDLSLFGESDEFLLSEIVVAATSEDLLILAEDDDFDPFESDFDGAVIITLSLPAVFFQTEGVDPEELVADFGESIVSDIDAEFTQETIELRGISGQDFAISMPDGRAGRVALLVDPSGNLVMFIAMGDEAYSTDVENALMSLTFYDFSEEELLDPENLTSTIEIAPDFAAVDIPPGWWMFTEDYDDLIIITPVLNQELLTSDPMEGLMTSGSMGIISLALEKDELDESAFNDDGTLNLSQVLTSEIDDEIESLAMEDWDGAPGLAGIQFEIEGIEANIKARGLLLDGDDVLYVVAGISTPDTWDTYSELIDAILLTIRRVEAD